MKSGEQLAGIEVEKLTKVFGATVANNNISFSVNAGSVHALLGENGAGKSTTIKLLSGLLHPDSGVIRIAGQEVSLKSPTDAHKNGIQTAFQELTLIPDLTVLDNMILNKGDTNAFFILKRKKMEVEISDHFEKLSINVDLYALAGELDLATKQKIEIAKALFKKPRILLLDEPTSALSGDDIEWLGNIIAETSATGTTIIFITHKMAEVRVFCDMMTILRNGEHVISDSVDNVSDEQVLELIIGRSLSTAFPPCNITSVKKESESPILQVKNLVAGDKLQKLDLELYQGEILGIAGLQGMGIQDVFLSLFGSIPIESGTISLDGKEVYLASPTDAVRASMGIGLVPEERKTQGLFLKMNGTRNVSLPAIKDVCNGPLINQRYEYLRASQVFYSMGVESRATYTNVESFSGGNQQKIAIAKWLFAQSRILLLFDPTRGIDVGTKQQIYKLMRDYTKAGGAILFHSTEAPELVNMSDRVAVLYEGKIDGWFEGDQITEKAIMESALGGRLYEE